MVLNLNLNVFILNYFINMVLIYLRINLFEFIFIDEIIEIDISMMVYDYGNYCSSKIFRFKKVKFVVF